MNWKRGLLRLWLLAAVLWLVGAGSAAVLQSSPLQERVYPPDEAACAAKRSSAEEFLDQSPDRTRVEQASAGSSRAADDLASPRFGACDSRIEYVRDWAPPDFETVAMIIGAPVLLFGLGVTTAWLAGGFSAKSGRAGEPTYKFNPERAASFLAEKPPGSQTQPPLWRSRVTLTLLALFCIGVGVTGTVIVYEIRNSYENCILRSVPGAPANALRLIHESCERIAW